MERAENYARFMDVNFNLSLELPPDISEQWKPVVVTTGDWELYNFEQDRTELQNLVTKNLSHAKQMQQQYQEWAQKLSI